MDLPQSAWESDDEPSTEKNPDSARRVNGIAWYWWCVAVFLVIFLGLGALALLR